MEIGKIPNSILKEIVLGKLNNNRKEILLRPGIGEDCCAVDFGEYACVLTTDPITGAVNQVGKIAVNIACNDIASSGAEPLGLLITLLAPPKTTEQDIATIMTAICDTANALNVDIIGGHTEITAAVSQVVIISTAVAKILKDKLVTTSGAKPGDDIIMTKSAGIEGTVIIASDHEDLLRDRMTKEQLKRAKSFVGKLSVVKEGIIAGKFGVNSMHDITEGGILGALWEIGEASGVGMEVYEDLIPVENETSVICDLLNLNPLKLISSGSMVITCDNGRELISELNRNGINAALIGKITKEMNRVLYGHNGIEVINEPESDELFKII
ncbi:AIR synthase family protein [Pseudobacteroides cellulosolvens]|uniref:AIR synthase related protein domain protein n=1 Tax=Pseudobacteroides cellulosolvens ATCC 35603 = DSM 2933 TaxID=398512 RepID=A0A0L6JQW6_9FIRM|nr:AIR synthase family protein [Pseudobacteroides cellulosolvens]KNY28211.1 AIR synthase related protein domain protein [Pseudobacteroides cellulosolvens ATCC 35603 = DSM 2933]